MEFIISQICGIIVSLAIVVSMQAKDIRKVLAGQLICNSVGALSYILVGGLSGCGIYIVALSQSVIYFIYRIKNKKAPLFLGVAFLILFLLCSFTTYQTPIDLLSAAAAVFCALAIMQEKPSVYRILILINGLIWVVYDLNVGAYAMILSHALTSTSALIGILRLDLKHSTGCRQ